MTSIEKQIKNARFNDMRKGGWHYEYLAERWIKFIRSKQFFTATDDENIDKVFDEHDILLYQIENMIRRRKNFTRPDGTVPYLDFGIDKQIFLARAMVNKIRYAKSKDSYLSHSFLEFIERGVYRDFMRKFGVRVSLRDGSNPPILKNELRHKLSIGKTEKYSPRAVIYWTNKFKQAVHVVEEVVEEVKAVVKTATSKIVTWKERNASYLDRWNKKKAELAKFELRHLDDRTLHERFT